MSIRPLWFVHLYPVEEKLYYPEVISNLYYLLRAFFFFNLRIGVSNPAAVDVCVCVRETSIFL